MYEALNNFPYHFGNISKGPMFNQTPVYNSEEILLCDQ